jgi:hypothetical protein
MAQTENEAVKLQNTTDVEQSVYFNGRRYTIPPQNIETFPREIAMEFLAHRAQFVSVFTPASIPRALEGENLTYIANVTGNLFLPLKVRVTRYHKGTEEEIEIDNPMRIARVIRHQMGIGQVYLDAENGEPDEKESINRPRILIELPPFVRLPFPAHVAEFLYGRDSRQEAHMRGGIIAARPPTRFEPNETWPLDDVRLYCGLMDPHSFSPYLDKTKSAHAILAEVEYKGDGARIDSAKRQLLNTLFFRLVDARYPLVDEAEFRDKKKELANAIGGKGK